MRKPRDLDQELESLIARTKGLKARKARQLGELVIATGAGALDAETLAGALLAMVEGAANPERKESWRQRGQGFFQGRSRPSGGSSRGDSQGAEASGGGVAASGSEPGAA
ncbi:MAG: conjugal transfer protein TraD [Caulobacteraceae bacterium]